MCSTEVRSPGWEPEEIAEARLVRLAVVCGQRNALDAEMVELTGEQLDAGIGGQGFVSMAHWVAHRTGCSPAQSARVVRVARRRRVLPVSYAAFREGRLSFDQMAAIARRVPAGYEAQACELAVMCTVRQLDRLFAAYPWPEPLDGDAETERPARLHATSAGFDDDGDYRLSATLPAEQGAVVDTALRAHFEALLSAWRVDSKAAETAGAVCRTPRPTMGDALERMADRSLDVEARDRPHHKRLQAVVHVDVGTPHAQLHLGPALPAPVRRSLTCDATMRVLYEQDGIALGIGRQSRDIPDRTRLAVEQRDGGCRVPGCSGRLLQIHHVWHWEDGGPTDTANLIALCGAHHRMHHRGELGIEATDADRPDGIVFTTALGCPLDRTIRPVPPPPGSTGPPVEPYQHPLGEKLSTNWVAFGPPGPD